MKTRSRIRKVGQKVNIRLPSDPNKLLLQWEGPYKVFEVLNRMDCIVDVNGKKKVFHAKMLKLTITHDDSEPTGEADEVDAAVSVAIIKPGDKDGVVDYKRLLYLSNVCQQDTYKHVNVSPDLTPEQVNEMLILLEEFQDIFTEKPGCTPLVEHKIDVTQSNQSV